MPRALPRTVRHPTIGGAAHADAAADARAILARQRWLSGVSADTIAQLAQAARFKHLDAGDMLQRRGAPVRVLALVLAGEIEMGASNAAGKRLVTDQARPGMPVGLAGLYSGGASLQDAQALCDSQVLLLPKADVLAAAQADPMLSQALLQLLAQRMRALMRSHLAHAFDPLPQRLCALLLRLHKAQRPAARSLGTAGAVQLSQDNLAAMLGVSRQHLSLSLQQLKAQGLVCLKYRQIELCDPDRLAARARALSG